MKTDFPKFISFTVTNACNLRCKMCGQWSETGYMHDDTYGRKQNMQLSDWKRLIDEITGNGLSSVLIRGGEPFLYPHIMELIEYCVAKGLFVSIDTNGTLVYKFAEKLVGTKKIHLTFSVDGPEAVHNEIRGMKDAFSKIKTSLAELEKWETIKFIKISKSMTFTISPDNYKHLGEMPDVARLLNLNSICIVPFYYIPTSAGIEYNKVLKDKFSCNGYSWKGFNREHSGIDIEIFKEQYRLYLNKLNGIDNYPYMPLNEHVFETWFKDATTPVNNPDCCNVERLIDIQPNGDANFCVDFPDFTYGNMKEVSIARAWNSEKAKSFRDYRRKQQLPVCLRCGAKYMSIERN